MLVAWARLCLAVLAGEGKPLCLGDALLDSNFAFDGVPRLDILDGEP